MQVIWQGMHTGASDWRAYGFYRGFMRSILQLRTSEGSGSGDKHQLGGLNGRSAVESIGSVVRFRDPQIEMAHGAGGKASRRLVEGLFAPILIESSKTSLGDAAHVKIDGSCVAITTDSFVVKPLRFPGGSIGELAVNGTLNDLAVSGARAQSMVVTFVLEEGLATSVLEYEVRAMASALRRAGVTMVGGDTKVVERGKADGMYITTTGIGCPIAQVKVDAQSVRPGDKILLSGPIGDHGITILLARGELDLVADLSSDTRSVLPLIEAMIEEAGPGIRWMRDPTRGGVATSLNELARDCGLGIVLSEEEIPIRDEVRGACELLGLDPLHIANEGQFLAVVAAEYADAALNALNRAEGGEDATIIGEVRTEPACAVLVTTRYGGSRIVDMLVGDPLPRIC
jgi:hydrogenase expression/formation protein HypE